MKKIIAVLLSGVMLASLVLCSCSTANAEKTEGQTEETVPVVLNEENIKKVEERYFSDQPHPEALIIEDDSIRGSVVTYFEGPVIVMTYYSEDKDNLNLFIVRDSAEVALAFQMRYGDESFEGSVSTDLTGLESCIDQMANDPESVDSHVGRSIKKKIKKDLPIYYSRMIALADKAYPELGLGFEDLGFSFGNKYRSVDPRQLASKEKQLI